MSQEDAEPAAPDVVQPSQDQLLNKLKKLEATATQQYALKNYSDAAESFSEAVEVQDAIHGEMATENAELLYLYGRCLYHVGVSSSDVLGGKVAQQEEPKRKKRKIVDQATGSGEVAESLQPESAPESAIASADASSSKPFFQITGDENWTDSEDEEEEEAADEEAGEEDDDLAIAYEILDTARVLFLRRIQAIEEQDPGAAAQEKPQPELRSIRERLADTYDLQAEIKLENEQFKDAVLDAQQALAYKLQLYPQESGMVAEAHYKLSIALDFASLPVQTGDGDDAPGDVDEDMRKQAAEEMEHAIMSCQARIKKGESSLESLEGAKAGSVKKDIAEARDMVKELKTRLVDLRSPHAGAASAIGDLSGADAKGLLGELLGQTKAEQLRMLTQATANANDLSGLVKQRKKPKPELEESVEGKGKRKIEVVAEEVDRNGKRVKFDNT